MTGKFVFVVEQDQQHGHKLTVSESRRSFNLTEPLEPLWRPHGSIDVSQTHAVCDYTFLSAVIRNNSLLTNWKSLSIFDKQIWTQIQVRSVQNHCDLW